MILIAGGTGRLGTLVVKDLTRQGVKVRVLTRDRRRAHPLEGIAEIVEGDIRRPATLPPAMTGVQTVVSAVHGFAGPGRVSPRSVDQHGNGHLITAAAEGGADMVMVSIVGASPESPMDLFRCKYAAELQLQSSGVPWTIVRATAFVELWADILSKGLVFGRGDNPINFVSVNDVAREVERAVLDLSLRGKTLEVGGPQDITFNEFAALLRQLRGEPERIRHIPLWLLRIMAPFHRQPRAALAMDTTDMRFCPQSDGGCAGGTRISEALTAYRQPIPG